MIVFDNVSLGGTDGVLFLKDFSARIESGQKVALVGASGSGKSSLLRAVVGGVPCWQGEVVVAGKRLQQENIHSIRTICGYIPQEPRLPAQSVELFCLSFFTNVGLQWDSSLQGRFLAICKQILLPDDLLKMDCRKLSGGQRQRLIIAAILALDRKIILADEITSALDKESKEQVMNLIFAADTTVFSVSHDPDWCKRCDRVIELTVKGKADE